MHWNELKYEGLKTNSESMQKNIFNFYLIGKKMMARHPSSILIYLILQKSQNIKII
jgi:hypothetical protein